MSKNEKGIPFDPKKLSLEVGPAKKEKRDWNKIVAENESIFRVPESLVPKAKDVEKQMREYNSKVEKMAEMEITMNMATQNFFFELRKHLAKEGVDVWTKEIGFNVAAMEDGEFIVNLKSNDR